jgi:hypothetical protein
MCKEKSYNPDAQAGQCYYCKSAKFEGASECWDNAVNFSNAAILAFIALGVLGITACFRRLCFTYSTMFCVNMISGKKNGQV